jgi:SAM-dependent methyltransferase
MDPHDPSPLQRSYDTVADEYVARIYDELLHKPLDRELLDRLAAQVCPLGPILDVGCGPGHVARYLHERGAAVSGLDLSAEMVARARSLNPEISFAQGDMRALPMGEASLGGIVASYSLLHIPRGEVVSVLVEFRRALRPGGTLLVGFHIGDEVVHLEEWWGKKVEVDFVFFRPEEMAGYLRQAGFTAIETLEREPYPDVEHPTRRAYLFAEKP